MRRHDGIPRPPEWTGGHERLRGQRGVRGAVADPDQEDETPRDPGGPNEEQRDPGRSGGLREGRPSERAIQRETSERHARGEGPEKRDRFRPRRAPGGPPPPGRRSRYIPVPSIRPPIANSYPTVPPSARSYGGAGRGE